MTPLEIGQFDQYFHELHPGKRPYSWQRRLAQWAVEGDWPEAIDLPTSSGKTASLDIAVFALACQASRDVASRNAPRRLFFCVNRRVIVDEAHRRAKGIAQAIWQAEQGNGESKPVLRAVAAALRGLGGTAPDDDLPPLDVLELRGGIYRDNRWARSVTQPTIVCTTIDQLGSRLLFRGYGVSSNAAPIQAALIAYDSLILLDEAHISRPFLQTLASVQRYLDPKKWAKHNIGVRPAIVVPMTATPPKGVSNEDVVRLDAEDRKNKVLADRLTKAKPAKLVPVTNLVSAVVEEAKRLAENQPTAVGVIVNRVATARAIWKELSKDHPDASVELVIGSMRPIDRDAQADRLRALIGPDRPLVTEQTCFVVATQCLEVGADYDFDALVTECASLDALRQRFGRLNRAGRDIQAEAVILAEKKSIKADDKLDDEKPEDPIYGNALARTWNWLARAATDETVDFGINSLDALLARDGEGRIPEDLLAPSAKLDAPVMLPAYVDFWCQTSPRPAPDPDVGLFLHGPQRGQPDVQVCWRADLIDDDAMVPEKHWCDVVSLLPPTSAECMTVPISRAERWLAGDTSEDNSSDLLGVAPDEGSSDDGKSNRRQRRGVLWRGANDSQLIKSPTDLRPGDTLVMPEADGGWDDLGHVPGNIETGDKKPAPNNSDDDAGATQRVPIDVAEAAFLAARDRSALRLHPSLRSRFPAGDAIGELFAKAANRDDAPSVAQWRELLSTAHAALDTDVNGLRATLSHFIKPGFTCEPYPDQQGVVLATRKRLKRARIDFLPSLDDGDDTLSSTLRKTPVWLTDHTQHVVDTLAAILKRSPLSATEVADALGRAAELHDLGKADERFQAMLLRADRTDAWLLAGRPGGLLAKGEPALSREQRRAARCRAGLPDRFRHEMLSVQLAERKPDLPDDRPWRDLVLHLIAAHHGYARPFAPVVQDHDPPGVTANELSLTTEDRLACPPHRLDSGIAERFWSLTRAFGWWGLAYLEATLRLADQQASAREDAGAFADSPNEAATETIR